MSEKSKFAFGSLRTSQLEDFSVEDLEKELNSIIEQKTKKNERKICMNNF